MVFELREKKVVLQSSPEKTIHKMRAKEPKYKSQLELLLAVDKMFFKALKKRELLIKDGAKKHSKKIIDLDLHISMCIKKRAKLTKGGYNFILTEMWEWRPHHKINNNLLPKITPWE